MWQPLREVGTLAAARLSEASGLASSRRRADLLWAVNDSGHPPMLHALDAEGRDLGHFNVEGARNTDWEDIASFELDATPYLLIADIGDNGARRARYQLYVVEEPSPGASTSVPVAWKISFVYPDGARDGEAAAVDVDGERVLLLSKSESPARVHAVPLRPRAGAQPVRAELVAHLDLHRASGAPRGSNRFWAALYEQPTSWDISGGAIAVLTYRRIEIYTRAPGEPLLDVLTRTPTALELPGLAQAESLAFARDAVIYVTGEGRAAPLLSTTCVRP